MNRNSVYILGIEAKDLYNSSHLLDFDGNLRPENEQGYSAVGYKNYLNALDYSLDLEKLREIYYSVRRKKDFSVVEGHKEYSNAAVVVKFNYAYKEFNKASKNIYVKAGYLYRDVRDIRENMLDKTGVCVVNGEVIAVRCNETLDYFDENVVLPSYFEYDRADRIIKVIKEPATLLTKSELRDELYKNGFKCNGEYFARDKRSSGSSRVGKCMFIYRDLYKKMLKWEMCGLDVKEGDEIDLASFESYISLPSSSCIDTMELRPENFLVIDDYESVFTDRCVAVEYNGSSLVAEERDCEVKNSIFDGQSIMDESMFENYPTRSMLLLRNRFFKSACFKGKVQKWFEDNGITEIFQLNGFTLAQKVSDIKIITTPSSIKYVKFGTLQQWFDNLCTTFGIVKHEKPTHYLGGKLVQCHYQLINTLHLSKKDIQELVMPSLEYINKIKEDPDVLKYHIQYPCETRDEVNSCKNKNEIVLELLGLNSDFPKTKLYKEFRNDLVKSMLDNYKEGHILIEGNYSTLLGNGVEMLQQAIGTFKGESIIGVGNVHSRRFPYGREILGSRSPHICSGNVLVVNNAENELIDKYFDLSKEVIYVNAINENIQFRLSGCDYDSDTLLITDNQILIDAAKRNYDLFKVPTSFVSAKKTARHYTASDKCDLDVKTSVNKIGEIVNLSQMLNSIMWDNVYGEMENGVSEREAICHNLDIYYDACILGVMSGIEIDKAKKEFDVNAVEEIARLKYKYEITDKSRDKKIRAKPMFFKMITLNNGYGLNPLHQYEYYETPMDYLQAEIDRFSRKKTKDETSLLPLSEILVEPPVAKPSGTYIRKKNKLIGRVYELKGELNKLYMEFDRKSAAEKEEIGIKAKDIKDRYIQIITNDNVYPMTAYLALKALDSDDKNVKKCSRIIFNTFFSCPNDVFYSLIKNSENNVRLAEAPNGEIELLGHRFSKIYVE